MKKYMFGIFAIAIALTISSFRANHTSNGKTGDLYWYPVSGGVTTSSTPDFHGSEGDAKTVDCPDSDDQPVCLYGSEDPALTSNTSVPMDNEDVIIREEE